MRKEKHYMWGKHHSEGTKKKLSKAFTGSNNPMYGIHLFGEKNGMYGKHHSEKSKQKMREARIGTKASEELKAKFREMRKGDKHPLWGKHHSEKTREKMINARAGKTYITLYGIKKAEELCKKNSERMKKKWQGRGNPMWFGGISFEPYGIAFNKILKEQIRKRDNYICQIIECRKIQNGKKFPIHHIDYCKKNNEDWNLITLCHSCHPKTNANRKYWESYFKGKTSIIAEVV